MNTAPEDDHSNVKPTGQIWQIKYDGEQYYNKCENVSRAKEEEILYQYEVAPKIFRHYCLPRYKNT